MKVMQSSKQLKTLIREIERGRIGIPAFQRDFVWSEQMVKNLLYSLHESYYIPPMVLSDEDSMVGLVPEAIYHGENIEEVEKVVLDGLQRLTALSKCFIKNSETNEPEHKYYLKYDDATGKIEITKRKTKNSIPIWEQNIPDDVDIDEVLIEKYEQALSNIHKYVFSLITIGDIDLNQAIELFLRLNNNTVKVSKDFRLLAKGLRENVDLINIIHELMQDKEHYDEFSKNKKIYLPLIIRAFQLYGYAVNSTSSSKIISLQSVRLDSNMDTNEVHLEKALDIIVKMSNQQIMYCLEPFKSLRGLIYTTPAFILNKIYDDSYEIAEDFLKYASISMLVNKISGKSLIKMSSTLFYGVTWEQLKQHKYKVPMDDYTHDEFINALWKSNRRKRGYAKSLLMINQPIDIFTHKRITHMDVEIDHLFPKKRSLIKGLDRNLIDSIGNMMMLSKYTNRKKSDIFIWESIETLDKLKDLNVLNSQFIDSYLYDKIADIQNKSDKTNYIIDAIQYRTKLICDWTKSEIFKWSC
jgi:hypothetical protein